MAAVRTIAALLVVLVAVVADDVLPSRSQMRQWVRECHKDAGLAKAKPVYAFKKTIAGLYDPRTHHAFRKTQVSFAKFEFATIRNPTQAEKCLFECLAEKQGMINGSQVQAEKVIDVMMALGKKINDFHGHTRVNITKLKRNTAKCIVGTHGSAQTCELGFRLYHCLKAAVMESLYEDMPTSTTPFTPSTAAPWAAATEPVPTASNSVPTTETQPIYRPPHFRQFRPMPMSMPMRRPERFMAPPMPMAQPMPVMGPAGGPPMVDPPMMVQPMMPQPMMAQPMMGPPVGVVPPPPGMSPALVAYRQGSGMLQVYGNGPSPWRSHLRNGFHHGPHPGAPMMGPML